MAWSDIFKIFTYSFEPDPVSRQGRENAQGAGITQPDAMPDLRKDSAFSGSGSVSLRESSDLVDVNSAGNRQSRYKEYDKLRSIAEVEMAMTVLADETCVSADTLVSTLFNGLVPIKTLADNYDQPFLVYCWSFEKNDYTLGWASEPRLVKRANTVVIKLDDGTSFTATTDHRILRRNGTWITAGQLKFGDELMPFYRERPNTDLTKLKINQFPRIYTMEDGWKHERQFIDEWKTGVKNDRLKKVNSACRMLSQGLGVRDTAKLMKHQWLSIASWIKKEGFSTAELKWLGKKPDRRRVVGVLPGEEMDVYDLSVKDHENFCGQSIVFHNCQKGSNGHLFSIECENQEIKDELDFLWFNRNMVNYDRSGFASTKKLFIKGDLFYEVVINPDNPKEGVLKIQELPPETMYRIETTRGKVLEFQQSKDGPDYDVVRKANDGSFDQAALDSSKVIRFSPDQIIHIKINDDRQEFHPYGTSILEPARGPAHCLRMMEDAMMVYRLTRAPERRVFYIDIGQLTSFKAEAFVDRIKDQFRKKKVSRGTGAGASAVEEKWHAPAQDEDYWLPIRPNSNTRIETLPGAQNLGEVDDVKYFRDKLFIAMNFPKNYFTAEDAQVTRISLSAQDVKFARMIERLQMSIEDGIWQICDKHLKLRGYPEEAYETLVVKMTPPSDWREMSRAEVVTNRINNASSLKGSLLLSDFDIMIDIMKIPEEEAIKKQSRIKMQKLDDLKLQVLAQNPQLLGVGVPSDDDQSQELGADAGGPNPMLGPDGAPQPDQGQPPEGPAPDQGTQNPQPDASNGAQAAPIPDASTKDIKKYDLQIQTYSSEMDREEIDYSEER